MSITTPVREARYSLDLPGQWLQVPAAQAGLWQYTSENGLEQLAVTIHTAEPPIVEAELPATLTQLQYVSQAGENRLSTETIMEPPIQQKQGEAWVGYYTGHDAAGGRRFASFTIVATSVIANFYYETLDIPGTEFDLKCQTILGNISVES